MRGSEASVVLCIDVEPDPRAFDPDDPPAWEGFERFVERFPAVRARLEEASGASAAFTWFLRMDPQVGETWGSPGWVAEVRRLARIAPAPPAFPRSTPIVAQTR